MIQLVTIYEYALNNYALKEKKYFSPIVEYTSPTTNVIGTNSKQSKFRERLFAFIDTSILLINKKKCR